MILELPKDVCEFHVSQANYFHEEIVSTLKIRIYRKCSYMFTALLKAHSNKYKPLRGEPLSSLIKAQSLIKTQSLI